MKFIAAAQEEIDRVTNVLRTAGFHIVQTSLREIEFGLPILPEPVSDELVFLEKSHEPAESETAFDGEVLIQPEFALPKIIQPEIVEREFVLAPLFRAVAASISNLQLQNRWRIVLSNCSRHLAEMWRKLAQALPRRWSECGFFHWKERILQRPLQVKELLVKKETKKELLAVSPRTSDRIGWVLTGMVVMVTLIVVCLGLYPDRQNPILLPEHAQATPRQPAPAFLGAASTASASATSEKASAARVRKHAHTARREPEDTAADNTPDVVLRHSDQRQLQPRLQQVAGVKHFSDMEE